MINGYSDKNTGKGYKGFDNDTWKNEWTNWLILNDYWSNYKDENIEDKFEDWYKNAELMGTGVGNKKKLSEALKGTEAK